MKSYNPLHPCVQPRPAVKVQQTQQRWWFILSAWLLTTGSLFITQQPVAASECTAYPAGAPCTTSADPGTATRQHQPQTLLANLVDSTSGNVFLRQTDYKHPETNLTYIRYYNSQLGNQQSATGFGWRSSYSVTLQKLSEQTLLLTQADGRQSVFRQRGDSAAFQAEHASEGAIKRDQRYWKWTTGQGNSIRFLGPFPVRYKFRDNSSLDLFYQAGQLKKVTDNLGNSIEFDYDSHNAGRLFKINLPRQNTLQYRYTRGQLTEVRRLGKITHKYSYDEVEEREADTHAQDDLYTGISSISAGINSIKFPPASTSQPSAASNREKRILRSLLLPDSGHCSNNSAGGGNTNSLLTAVEVETVSEQQQCEQSNPSAPVNPLPTVPGAIFREVFAADCVSYFDAYAGTGRGFRIEEAIMQHEDYAQAQVTATRFPVLDILDNRVAVAIVSRDLRSPSYSGASNESALYYKLLADAAHMHDTFLQSINANQQVSATQEGLTTTIYSSDFDTFVFELVVQRSTATAAHIAQIQRAAAEMLRLYGIRLRVVEIP